MKKIIALMLTLVCLNTTASADVIEEITSSSLKIPPYNNKGQYGFEHLQKKVLVAIKADESIKTNSDTIEGQLVKFHLAKDLTIGEKVYKAGTPVEGRVELISMNQPYGVPADITVGNFVMKDGNQKIKLDGAINAIGANRSYWVYPVGYIGGAITLGLGFAAFTIRGGHAKIKPGKQYELYYIPTL